MRPIPLITMGMLLLFPSQEALSGEGQRTYGDLEGVVFLCDGMPTLFFLVRIFKPFRDILPRRRLRNISLCVIHGLRFFRGFERVRHR